MRKLMFTAGVAVGYVLGARAGRERYEKLKEFGDRLMANPALRNTVDSAALSGRQAATWAAGAVADRTEGRLPGPVTSRLRAVGQHERDEQYGQHERDEHDERDDAAVRGAAR